MKNKEIVNFEEFMKRIKNHYQDNPIVRRCIDSYLHNKEEITFMDCIITMITALIGVNTRLESRLKEEIQNNITHRPIVIPFSDMRNIHLEEVKNSKMKTLKETKNGEDFS